MTEMKEIVDVMMRDDPVFQELMANAVRCLTARLTPEDTTLEDVRKRALACMKEDRQVKEIESLLREAIERGAPRRERNHND